MGIVVSKTVDASDSRGTGGTTTQLRGTVRTTQPLRTVGSKPVSTATTRVPRVTSFHARAIADAGMRSKVGEAGVTQGRDRFSRAMGPGRNGSYATDRQSPDKQERSLCTVLE
jgi:hypothetical protein